MNPLTLIFRLPLLPVDGFLRVAELIRDQAEQQLHDPASVRRQLEAAEEALRSGEISEEEFEGIQAQAVARMIAPGPPAGL